MSASETASKLFSGDNQSTIIVVSALAATSVLGMGSAYLYFQSQVKATQRALELKEEEFIDEDGKKTIKATTSSLLPSICLKGGSKNQNREKIVKPFSRCDLYYQGNVQKLVGQSAWYHGTMVTRGNETWDEFRHFLLSSTRYNCFVYVLGCAKTRIY